MNSAGFAATKAAFVAALTEDKVDDKSGKVTAAKFNEDDVVGMVVRNPNLINIRPSGYGGADTSDESTVYKALACARAGTPSGSGGGLDVAQKGGLRQPHTRTSCTHSRSRLKRCLPALPPLRCKCRT